MTKFQLNQAKCIDGPNEITTNDNQNFVLEYGHTNIFFSCFAVICQ
jgi:hypothetical protein